jgi:non-ribosomal peptide synthetase component F
MINHYQNLLAAVVQNPRQHISEIPLLSELEMHGYSSRDFPDANLSRKDLENILMELSGISDMEES